MLELPLILALDIGTSSVRASIYDRNGNFVEGTRTSIKYSMSLTADGGAEIDAESLFSIVAQSIDGTLALLQGRAAEPAGVAVSTFWHSLMGIDAQGRAITPVINWSDTRGREAAAKLREQVNEKELHARTGCRAHASYWPAKLLWLTEINKDLVKDVQYWLSFGDYLFLRLFGKTATSISMASGTGLFNQQECRWDEEIIELLPIRPEQLPSVIDLDQPISGLESEFASRWPALGSIPWHLPLGDGACSNIGSGSVDPGSFTLMIGTSGALRAITAANDFVVPSGLWSYRIDRRRRILGGALSNGGNLFAWMKETLKLPDDIESALASVEPDSHGLTLLPHFSGERSPGWHDSATAVIAGLRLSTLPAEILRAGFEAVAYQFATIYEEMVKSFGLPREVIGTGGGLRNSVVWRQIIADALGVPLRMSAVREASSRGAALLALEAMGEGIGSADFAEQYLPDEENHRIYVKARERHQVLYDIIFNHKDTKSTKI
jgi:gluconokinase